MSCYGLLRAQEMRESGRKINLIPGLLASLFFLLFFSACQGDNSAKIITIHPLKDLFYASESESFTGEKYSIKNEFFVISGISDVINDRELIRSAVKAYNLETLKQSDLKQYYAYIRSFYRESEYTPRDYKESNRGYFDHDRIEFHSDDLTLIVKWTEFGEIEEYLFQ